MEEQVSRRDVLESVGQSSSILAVMTVAGCIETGRESNTTHRTSDPEPTTQATHATQTKTKSNLTSVTSSQQSTASPEEPAPCASAFNDGPTPDDTTTPECDDTDLDVYVYGRPKTPTPTDSTSTPYEFEKVIVVEVELTGEHSRSLKGCIEVDCPNTEYQSVSIPLPESKTTRTYEFGPFGYHCLGRISFWIGGCQQNQK
jgi:hypothetical protein